jgi:hypothetical protein
MPVRWRGRLGGLDAELLEADADHPAGERPVASARVRGSRAHRAERRFAGRSDGARARPSRGRARRSSRRRAPGGPARRARAAGRGASTRVTFMPRRAKNRPSSAPVARAARHGGAVGQVAIGGSPRGWSIAGLRQAVDRQPGGIAAGGDDDPVGLEHPVAGRHASGPADTASFLTMVAPRCGSG